MDRTDSRESAMDLALSNSIVSTATQMASAKNSDALNVLVLKKALDQQKDSASALLDALPQPAPTANLATSGNLGTQVNAWA